MWIILGIMLFLEMGIFIQTPLPLYKMEAPIITELSRTSFVITLECSASGNPTPVDLYWMHVTQDQAPRRQNTTIIRGNKTIKTKVRIKNVRRKIHTEIQCYAVQNILNIRYELQNKKPFLLSIRKVSRPTEAPYIPLPIMTVSSKNGLPPAIIPEVVVIICVSMAILITIFCLGWMLKYIVQKWYKKEAEVAAPSVTYSGGSGSDFLYLKSVKSQKSSSLSSIGYKRQKKSGPGTVVSIADNCFLFKEVIKSYLKKIGRLCFGKKDSKRKNGQPKRSTKKRGASKIPFMEQKTLSTNSPGSSQMTLRNYGMNSTPKYLMSVQDSSKISQKIEMSPTMQLSLTSSHENSAEENSSPELYNQDDDYQYFEEDSLKYYET